ncbi:hypothetical protein F8388_011857 [Cannabis sativa]|uniref:Uncharacterized protein n=1 Tax=Cannabis sativa TaxID=3483 RepID=A0A7J6GD97_CANSA|nr:hypothetical protein F8388_011857 [Cannabis sativa]
MEEEKKNECVIIEIPEDLKNWSDCVIYRVPRKLRKVNESSFTPQLLSIGPFHHGRNELKGMEPHKEKYLEDFYQTRSGQLRTVELTHQVFDQMILRDSCFILELLCLFSDKGCQYHDQDDYLLKTPWLRNVVQLDLFWLSKEFRREERRGCPFREHEKYLYSATKLNKAGVKFAPSANKQAKFVEFNTIEKPLFNFIPFLHSLKVELPTFEIQGNTETLMRNVIALEQCVYPDKAYICNYVALMSQLVDTAEDIEFLVEKRIIKNMLGSNKEVAELVNKLTYKITESNFVYANKCRQLNRFYETRFNIVRATLKRVYFNDLWTGSSTVLGICILMFSVSSTIKTLFFSKD